MSAKYINSKSPYIKQLEYQLSAEDMVYLKSLNLPSASWAHDFRMAKSTKDLIEFKHYIYVLELVNNKFYIGLTDDPKRRIFEHFCGRGSDWTKLHKPIKLIDLKLYVNVDNSLMEKNEESITLEYFQKYGVENVRGSKWSYINLYYPPIL